MALTMYELTLPPILRGFHAKNGVSRLTGAEPPPFADAETTFAELGARITKTTEFLRSIDKAAFEGSDTRYLMAVLLPDFDFHVATAHGILRHRGIPLGKVDYLGRVTS